MREDRLFEIEYGYWFNQINERAYRRLDLLLNAVQLLGGSAAAMAAFSDQPAFVIQSGFALAVCAVISLLVQPGVQAEQHRACKAAFLKLKGRAQSLCDADLSAAVADLQSEGPGGISITKDLAFNATAHATGASHGAVPLGRLQRVWAALI
jgi:hypothetical protein